MSSTKTSSAPQAAASSERDNEQAIQNWRIRHLIQSLENARGNGTSMISLIIPPGEQISRYTRLLAEEFGTASNIKSRVNRLSVINAITSTQQKLKLYNRIPDNGLVIYCGTIITEDNKEKLVNLDIVPHRAINTSLYLCDNRFHTQCLSDLLVSDTRYGFIIMDGNGALFGLLSGNTKSVLARFSVELPKKHGRGGQSAVRFARLRLEKRRNYIRRVAEIATQSYITNDRPNICGLVLAGSADFKNELAQLDSFDGRLQRIVIKILDLSYGGEVGFNQAIDFSQEALRDLKFVAEKQILQLFLDQIVENSRKYCFGVRDTIQAMEAGVVDRLIVYEDLAIWRHELRYIGAPQPGAPDQPTKIVYTNGTINHRPKVSPSIASWEPENDPILLIEWLVHNYQASGCKLEIISNKSQEGSQFANGFGGVGAILRYPMTFDNVDSDEGSDGEDASLGW